jgi:LL-diaminopimelate aminotransferase
VTSKLTDSAANGASHGYQPYNGIPQLRQAFSAWYLSKYGVRLSPENEVLPLLGSKEGIMHISLAFLNRGDAVLLPDPGYPAYEAAARICNARPMFYDLDPSNGWLPDLDAIERGGLDGVKLMWVNYPNMPTGSNGSVELFENLVEFGIKHNILIVNDNPYSFILNDNPISILSAGSAMEIALELNSLSKSHNMAGWRVGVVTGNSEYLEAILKVKSNIDSGMFQPVQLAATEALTIGDEWYEELNRTYKERRKLVHRLAQLLGCSIKNEQSGMFVWAEIPGTANNSIEFSDLVLANHRIFVTPGSIFGSNGSRYIRISLCLPAGRIEECIERVTRRIEIAI